jgi:hypothetical protein
MNPMLTLLAASGVALSAVLIVASGLIHARLKRRKAVAAGSVKPRSRILNDLRPVENLLVGLVSHTRELATVVAILSSFDAPASFARLVHEIRIGRNASTDPSPTTNLVVPALFILGLAGLIRVTGHGFEITEIGREVERRISHAGRSGKASDRVALEASQINGPAAIGGASYQTI